MKPRGLIQMVSKPVAPPWDDSGKNIVKAQIDCARNYAYRIMSTSDFDHDSESVECEGIYGDAGTYSPGYMQNLKALRRALFSSGASLLHYFFAPNPVSSTAGGIVKMLGRIPCVQTVSSAPRSWEGIRKLLFADRIIVLSEYSRTRMLSAGIEKERVCLVPPGITDITHSPERARKIRAREIRARISTDPDLRLIIYPGDLEFSSAAKTIMSDLPAMIEKFPSLVMVFACRKKTPAAAGVEEKLKHDLSAAGLMKNCRFVGRVDNIHDMLAASDIVILPADDLYAKMDIPLVLIEAMQLGRCVLVADSAPLNETVGSDAGFLVEPGKAGALASAITELLSSPDKIRIAGDKAAVFAENTYSAQRMTRDIELIYDEILEHGK